MTQTTPAGWYPDSENPTQQRYWDGAAWTENVAFAQGTDQPLVDAPVLQTWQTSTGFSVLGLLVGFPLAAFLMTLLAMPLMMVAAFLTGSEALFPLFGPLLWNILMIVYAAIFYPSYFTEKPRLRSSKMISFANLMFGGLIFGLLWNSNLTKKTKGISYAVAIVLDALFVAYLLQSIFFGLLFGPM